MQSAIGELAVRTPEVASAPPSYGQGVFDAEVGAGAFIFETIGRWAREDGARKALTYRDRSLTYAELEALTNRLARRLRACGVRVGGRVALVLPRGGEAVISLIAVLKAGAAYVPIDADSPAERIGICLEDAQADLVVARPGAIPGSTGTSVLTFEALAADAASEPAEPLAAEELQLSLDDHAYVIFTSGTTGRPKGVPITHRGLANFARGCQKTCIRVEPADCVFQGFSPASDGHVEEIWPTLLAGGRLAVASADDVHDGAELGEFLNRHRVSIISCAPTLLSMVEEDVPTLRRILFGAERCPDEVVRRWWTPAREVLNTYGPTEATVGATFGVCTPDRPITIGRPLPNYYCYVLDEQMRPVPDGGAGELCVAGVGLSPGYLNNPELTSEKFLPNPYARPDLHNPVLYRTGDRVRVNEDGDIEWLGRIDSQVKVRGYRIELSDIESHALHIPSVRSALATVRQAPDGSSQIALLLVPRAGSSLDATACMAQLRTDLPPYMVPHILEEVPALPVLPSGKLDRKSAANLRGTRLEVTRDVRAAETETEQTLLTVLGQVFPGQVVGVTDDFFIDLGGYSLLAARFLSLLRNEHGLTTVSVRDLYAAPTMRALAALVDARGGAAEEPGQEAPRFKEVPSARYNQAVVLQGLGVLFLLGYRAAFWLLPIIVGGCFVDRGASPVLSVAAGLLAHVLSVPIGLAVPVILKRLLGRIEPGEYPVWGREFVRWWFIQRLMEWAPKDYLVGSPLAGVYMRLLGARVGRNVSFESLDIDCPELVEIGDDCVIDCIAFVRAGTVAHGTLALRPIKIGNGCYVGVRAGVPGGCVLEDGVWLDDLACLPEGSRVPAGQEWEGTPARKCAERRMPAYVPSSAGERARERRFGAAQVALTGFLAVLDTLPFSAVGLAFYRIADDWVDLAATPLLTACLILAACLQVIVVKWVVVGRVKPGIYSATGSLALRKWFVDRLLELQKDTIAPIYDTLMTRAWCLALGMKLGKRVEMDLPERMPYDLVELGDESFVASEVSVGLPRRWNGQLILERTVTADRVFLGNDSVIAQGTDMPRESLIGALSVAPTPEQAGGQSGQSWLGAPVFRMAHREQVTGFDEERTYHPTRRLYVERFSFEMVRILLPAMASLGTAVMVLKAFMRVWQAWSPWAAIALLPVLYLPAVAAGLVAIYVAKRIFIGKYAPAVQPLWSRFVWRTETFSTFFHDFGGSLFVSALIGSPYMAMFMRFMGARIGKRAFIDTQSYTEFDVIEVGDDAAVNHTASLQAHLFEDRVMKMGTLNVGPRSSVGIYAVVLFDSEVQADSHVGHISLVMKGETIPSGTCWEGSPAQPRARVRIAEPERCVRVLR